MANKTPTIVMRERCRAIVRTGIADGRSVVAGGAVVIGCSR
jgi:hypothetical protein